MVTAAQIQIYHQQHLLSQSLSWGTVLKQQNDKQSYLRIQIKTPVRQMSDRHSNSAGPSASCRKGLLTQHEIRGLDPEPESPATSGGHRPSGGAELQATNHFNYNWKQKRFLHKC